MSAVSCQQSVIFLKYISWCQRLLFIDCLPWLSEPAMYSLKVIKSAVLYARARMALNKPDTPVCCILCRFLDYCVEKVNATVLYEWPKTLRKNQYDFQLPSP